MRAGCPPEEEEEVQRRLMGNIARALPVGSAAIMLYRHVDRPA